MRIYFFTIFLVLFITKGFSQYADKSFSSMAPQCTGWGCWVQYITYSPKYMGPNALPVPDAIQGCVDKESEFETRLVGYSAQGDNTQNLFVRINVPVLPNVISVEINNVVAEHYNMDIQRRTELSAWHGYGQGTVPDGDINLNTVIQIIRDNKFPDIAVRFDLRTTSGKHLSDARHTDSPGYFMDLSMGKQVSINSTFFQKARFYLSGGFYCWQTNKDIHMQDDAPMLNIGANITSGKLVLGLETAGYYGYLNNGDRPLVVRANLNYKSRYLTYKFGYQKGLHDYDYSSLYFGFILHFDLSNYTQRLSYKSTDENNEKLIDKNKFKN